MNGYFLFFIISHAKTVIHHVADLFWAWPSSLDLKRHIILNLIGPGIVIAILSAIMLRSHARRRHALRRFFQLIRTATYIYWLLQNMRNNR